LINPPVIDEYLEALLVDYRFKARNFLYPPSVPDNILIVAIDEKSLSEYGRWPWDRRLQAELIEKVFEGHPKAVALDIFYPEPESPESDRALAEVFNKYRDRLIVALGFEIEKGKVFKGEVEDVLYEHTILRIENQSRLKSFAFKAHRVLLPPEPIASSATFGHVNSLPDRDGKLRWENPFIKYSDEYFPSLAIQTARISRGLTHDEVTIVGGIGVDLGGQLIPTDESHRLHINYLGKERTFIYKSAADVLSGLIPVEFFKDKIVLIGASAIATYDLKNTPFSANMPGVEKNATVVANIMSKDFIKKSEIYVDLFLVLLTGISALLMSRKQRAFYSFMIYLSLTAILIITNQLFFTYYGIRINFIYPIPPHYLNHHS
ncbi:MAG: CHASE2 domain-containing protein, partial [Candidatus Mariimomonas ferrooxydans]